MLLKSFIVLLLLAVIYNLGRGMHYLMKDTGDSTRMVRALTWRIGLSLSLFFLLFVFYALGWIQPHSVL